MAKDLSVKIITHKKLRAFLPYFLAVVYFDFRDEYI